MATPRCERQCRGSVGVCQFLGLVSESIFRRQNPHDSRTKLHFLQLNLPSSGKLLFSSIVGLFEVWGQGSGFPTDRRELVEDEIKLCRGSGNACGSCRLYDLKAFGNPLRVTPGRRHHFQAQGTFSFNCIPNTSAITKVRTA